MCEKNTMTRNSKTGDTVITSHVRKRHLLLGWEKLELTFSSVRSVEKAAEKNAAQQAHKVTPGQHT